MIEEPDRNLIYILQLNGENNWTEICMFHQLSEEFMEEFRDCLDWTQVSINQTMSYDFIKKYITKLNPGALLKYQRGMPMDLRNEVEKLLFQQIYKNS